MAKTKTVPASDSRESPKFWRVMMDASDKRRDRVNEQFSRFARWHRGDLRDVVDPKVTEDNLRWQSGLENMLNLTTVASLADLLFRWPQFVVNVPYVAPPPAPMLDETGMPLPPQPPQTLFDPKLARCQTTRLMYILRRTNYLLKARRSLQDCLLGGIGVLKITADQEVVVDEEVLAAAQAEAQQELVEFLSHGVEMKAQEKQLHAVHIEIKRQALSQAEKGVIQLPRAAIRYLRNHIAFHERMKWSDRPTETIRSSQFRVRRINPLDYYWDPTVDDRDDATWRGTRYLVRRADVLANTDYEEQARLEAMNTQDRWESRTHRPSILSPGSFDVPEDMVMLNEVFDFVDQRRYLFADGASVCLIPGEDRGDLKELQPSGPFNELVFVEDTMESHGVTPPSAFESEQSAATAISSSHVRAAIQSVPKTMYNQRDIDPADASRIWNAGTGEFVGVNPKGDPKKALADCFDQIPIAEISEQNLAVLASLIQGIERRSGLGAAKTGGGESSPTATGAALGSEAAGAVSEDRGALVDAWQERSGRMLVRLDRRFTPKSQWVEVCGDEALECVPDRFTLMESANDIAVEIIPGSSRRRNTSVDQKQLLDGVTAVAGMPMFQGPAGSQVVLQLVRRFFDDAGMSGINWAPLEQEAAMMAQIAQTPPGGAGAPGGPGMPPGAPGSPGGAPGANGSGPPVGPANDHPPKETMGVAENDLAQGAANVGGGRIATGASVGDKIRQYRGAAVQATVSRRP